MATQDVSGPIDSLAADAAVDEVSRQHEKPQLSEIPFSNSEIEYGHNDGPYWTQQHSNRRSRGSNTPVSIPLLKIPLEHTSIDHEGNQLPLLKVPSMSPAARPPKHGIVRSWSLELAALLLSISAFGAAIVLLVYWHHRLLDDWKGSISLNTFVSTLGAAHQAGLAYFLSACIGQHKWNWFYYHTDRIEVLETFDEASRGPLGGVKLMWQILPRWNLSFLATFVLVASLAFDPFLQAAISLSGSIENTAHSNNVPSVGRATYTDLGELLPIVNSGTRVIEFGDTSINPDAYSPYPGMGLLSAIFNGLDDSPWAQTGKTVFSCPTGNCTWAPFTSAGVCSTCVDVSKHIVKENGVGYPSNQPPPEAATIEENYTSFNLSYCNIKNSNSDTKTTTYTTYLTANMTSNYLQTISFQEMDTLFLSMLIMGADPSWLTHEVLWENSKPRATECGLYFCVNLYNSSVQNGTLTEGRIASWQDKEPRSWRTSDVHQDDAFNLWDQTHPSLDDYPPIYRSDLQLSVPSTNLTRSMNINATERFNITQGTIVSIQDWIQNWGFGCGTGISDCAGTPTNLIVYPIQDMDGSTARPLVETLYKSKNLNTTFQNLAESITNNMRDSSNITAIGEGQEWIIRFKVQWVYLILPSLHLLFGTAYVIAIVWQTKRSRLPVWKESLMPSLAYGFDPGAQELLRSTQDSLGKATQHVQEPLTVNFDCSGLHPRLQLKTAAGGDMEALEQRLRWEKRFSKLVPWKQD